MITIDELKAKLGGMKTAVDDLLIAGSIAGGVVLGWIMARGLGVA